MTRTPQGGLRYAAGAWVTGTFGTVPGLLLLYYLTDTLAVPAAVAGAVVAVPKLGEVFLHAWVGRRVDATARARPGRRARGRRVWMACAGVGLSAGFALLFAAPTPRGPLSAVWTALFFVVCVGAYSCFQVPYTAALAQVTTGSVQRVRFAAWRTAVYGLAVLACGALAPRIARHGTGQRAGYAVAGVVFGVLVLGAALTAAFSVPADAPAAPADTAVDAGGPVTWRQQVALVRGSVRLRRLLGVQAGQSVATAMMLAGAQYFATYGLHDAAATSVLMCCLVVPLLAAAPVWHAACRRGGAAGGLAVAVCLFGAGALALGAASVVPRAVVYGCVAVCGVGYAGMQTLGVSLLGDLIAAGDPKRPGHDRGTGMGTGGGTAGAWSAVEAAGTAVGPAVFSVLLALTGFVASAAGRSVVQPGAALAAIVCGVSVAPALALVPAVVCAVRLRGPDSGNPDGRERGDQDGDRQVSAGAGAGR
ncbi:MFS transporter [Streptacidiphilus fuscans]|uniref:MFS transporter n=1 Tax=Streptacidiphilus fuscans TaxID=2789292 RepID=A0A931FCF2_9ACTN|nr:MFS transporter [Streptacidiphilus fuscans]MBF9067115.1 MFS transporter [Streptacidiphilus fuscans]